mgnify:CR=1 FL=1|jgi:repressor LexA|nr:MAG TPA: Repressor protein CI [Caudoviricetes sp.]
MAFKDVLKRERKKKGLTQNELSRLTGLTKSAISMYETGQREPNFETCELLADFFNIDMDVLLDRKTTVNAAIKIPILGHVIAGVPIEAITDILGYEEITQNMADTGDFFALKIQGHSMEPRLEEGDIVIVRKQSYADSGDIAIILVNGNEATCKQIKKSDTGITLIGFNPVVYPPHFYSKEEIASLPVSIIGIVVESRHTWLKI